MKAVVQEWWDNCHIALDYLDHAPRINLVTDVSLTGASGYISQGDDIQTANIVTFWSGKFNSAQQNYPAHEHELLAIIIKSLKQFWPLLHGAKFQICTDHRAMEAIMTQKNLSPRQRRWMDVLDKFESMINYIPGPTNILADALSCKYSDEPDRIERAASEYIKDDRAGLPVTKQVLNILWLVYTGAAAMVSFTPRWSS